MSAQRALEQEQAPEPGHPLRVYAVLEVPTVLPAELSPNRRFSTRDVRRARAELAAAVLVHARNYVRSWVPAGFSWPLASAEVDVRYLVRPGRGHVAEAYRPTDNDNAATAGSKAVLDALVGAGMLAGDAGEQVPWSPRWRVERIALAEQERLVVVVREPFGF